MSRSTVYDIPGSGGALAAYAAILTPDERIGAPLAPDGAASGSSYTEADPLPGLATYQGAALAPASTLPGVRRYPVRLAGVGSYADPATATEAELYATRGGLPGAGMELVQRPDAQAQWRGWETPNVLQHVLAEEVNRGVDQPSQRNYTLTPTAAGQILVITSNSSITGRIVDPVTHAIGAPFVIADPAVDADLDAATYATPTAAPVDALLLPSGRIIVYGLTAEIDGAQQVWAHYSDDHGETWRSAQAAALVDPVPYTTTVLRLAAAYSSGAVALVLTVEWDDGQGTARGLLQYASTDEGHTFALVDDYTDGATDRAGLTALVADAATGIIAALDIHGGILRHRRIAHPAIPLRSVPDPASGPSCLGDDVVAWADELGHLWAAYGPHVEAVRLARSVDGGATWAALETPPLVTDAAQPIDRWEACAVAGRAWWLIGDSAGARPAYRMAVACAGGWSGLLQPRQHAAHPRELAGWAALAPPLALPSAYGWSVGGLGSLAVSAIAGQPWRHTLTTTGTQTAYARRTLTGTRGLSAQWSLQLATAGSTAAAEIGVELIDHNSGTEHLVQVCHDRTRSALRDPLTGASASGSHGSIASHEHVFRAALADGHAALYVRHPASEEWALVASLTVTSRAGAGPSRIDWGHLSAAAHTSTWGAVGVCARGGADLSRGTWEGYARDPLPYAPASLHGAPVPAPPFRLPLDPLLGVQASAGPATRGDRWALTPASPYPAADVAQRSPRRPWRSQPTTAAERLVWEWGPVASHPLLGSWGVYVGGANIRQLYVQGWDGAAWADLLHLDLAEGLDALPFTRDGDLLTVDLTAADPAARYLLAGEHDGCTVDLGGGTLRTIAQTRAGAWSPTAGSTRAYLRIADPDGSEPADGTLSIWRTEGAAVLLGEAQTYTRIAVTIPGHATHAGYYQLGRVIIGPCHVLPTAYSRGADLAYIPQIELLATPTGRAARTLGPTTRRASVAWVEGADAGIPGRGADSADWLAAGGVPVATRGDLSPIDRIAETFDATKQLVILRRIEISPATPGQATILGRDRLLYGSLAEPPEASEWVDGRDEHLTPIRRGWRMIITEEP